MTYKSVDRHNMMGGRGFRVEQLKFRTFLFQFLALVYPGIQVYPHYWLGLCLVLAACVTGGAMDVVVAGGSTSYHVSTAVLANWAAVAGLGLSLVFTVAEEIWGPFLLSGDGHTFSWHSWQSVALYIGEVSTQITLQGANSNGSTNINHSLSFYI